MKNLLFILPLFVSFQLFAQKDFSGALYSNGIYTAEIQQGQALSVSLRFSYTDPTDYPKLISVTIRDDRRLLEYTLVKFTTRAIVDSAFSYSFIVPNGIAKGSEYKLMVNGNSVYRNITVISPTAIESPLTSPDKEFTFYSILGANKTTCKFTDLPSGMWVCERAKYLKD